MHDKLEADRLCSARTIYALALWVVWGDQICKHKRSGRTFYDSINGPPGPGSAKSRNGMERGARQVNESFLQIVHRFLPLHSD